MSRKLTCPYCYGTFSPKEIRFRCDMRVSPTREQCRPDRDEVLAAFTGIPRELGPVFDADGRRLKAACPSCGLETRHRVCPHSHHRLPAQFGEVEHRMLAMVGAADSGKTVYMTVLIHELMNRVGERLDASLMGADDETVKRFASGYEDKLYESGQIPMKTERAASRGGRVDPLVFRLSLPGRKAFRSDPLHTILSFFDGAGEDFESQASRDLNARYLASADGILLILDPRRMPGARRAGGLAAPAGGADVASPLNSLSGVTELLLDQPGAVSGGRIKVPLAVVVTKIDELRQDLDRGSPLLADSRGGRQFDTADGMDVHMEMSRLLREWEGSSITAILDKHYQKYQLFGVSALGRRPTADNDVDEAGIQPFRVADPFVWLLSELGAVGRTARK
jgi:hypothetical protein